ncbi:MAG: PEP-CTERM sorting domain-containing protein [Tepidisphaeraceae bacterium]
MNRNINPLLAAAILFFAVSAASASPTYVIDEIGLTGTNYSYATSGGIDQYSIPEQLNAAGQVIGYSQRYSSSGGDLGADSWFYNGSSTQQIGLTGTNYSYATSGGTYQDSEPGYLNAAGQVSGYSQRYSSSGGDLGADSWIYSGSSTQQIGLTGTNYTYATSGGTYQNSVPQLLNAAGQVGGCSYRYTSSGGDLGQDTWIYNGSSTQQIGLTGTNYSYATSGGTYQYSSLVAQYNAAGYVLGYSDRYSSSGGFLGSDSWIYNGSSTQQIGLTGTNYSYATSGGTYQNGMPDQLNAAGQVSGISLRYSSSGGALGQDTWIYNGSSTQQIGLTGTNYGFSTSGGTRQDSQPDQLNAAGQVIGYSYRHSSSGIALGQDTWIYNGSSTQQIGLTGPNYSDATSRGTVQYSWLEQLNAAGRVLGYSERFSSSGGFLGDDSWIYNGSSTRQIGLIGTNYSYAASGGTYENSKPLQLNAAGQVIGYSFRYSSSGGDLGTDGWFFDPATDQTTLLQFSVDSATNYSATTPQILTDSGVVLGQFELYSGSLDDGSHAFYWSEGNGFSDLGALVSGGLSAQGWENLAFFIDAEGSAADGSPLFIAGYGQTLGTSTGSESAILLSQNVPEPGTASLLIVASSGILMHRRRR